MKHLVSLVPVTLSGLFLTFPLCIHALWIQSFHATRKEDGNPNYEQAIEIFSQYFGEIPLLYISIFSLVSASLALLFGIYALTHSKGIIKKIASIFLVLSILLVILNIFQYL